jgi:hypothetical protein
MANFPLVASLCEFASISGGSLVLTELALYIFLLMDFSISHEVAN